MPNPPDIEVRLALTLPGAVSLGAYHAGALAALLTAAQHSDGRVAVDVMAGASAGSITAVLAAHSLLRGADPTEVMAAAWVSAPALRRLRNRRPRAPLTTEPLEQVARDLLGPRPIVPTGTAPRQRGSIRLSFALASLSGLHYTIPHLDPEHPEASRRITAVTFEDWWNRTVTEHSDFVDLAHAALASGANPLGFLPRRLTRSSDDVAEYRRNGITALPPGNHLWYSDGGAVDNEPFGRTIDTVNELAEIDPATTKAARLYLLIQPLPAALPSESPWWNLPLGKELFFPTLAHVGLNVRGASSVFDDLRRLERTNTRIAGQERLLDALGSIIKEAVDAAAPSEREARAARIDAVLRDFHEALIADQAMARELAGRPATPASLPPSGDPMALLRDAMEHVSGLRGKRRVQVEVIQPDGAAAKLLAGDFFWHFGGFVAERFRRHDFLVGWDNTQHWLESCSHWPDGVGLDAVAEQREMLRRRWPGCEPGAAQDPQWSSLPTREKLDLVLTGLAALRTAWHDAWRALRRRDSRS